MELFTRRLGNDFDAGFERVFFVEENQVGFAFFPEEELEHLFEVFANSGKSLGETLGGFIVNFGDDFQELSLRIDEVFMLSDDEVVALFEFFEFFDSIHVDGAHGVELTLQLGDEGFNEVPVWACYFELRDVLFIGLCLCLFVEFDGRCFR